jgi:hypothetical protein
MNGRNIPLLTELENVLISVSTKMQPLTGLGSPEQNPKVRWTEIEMRNTVAAMKRVNIAIASPSDVQKERDAVLKVFTRWNDANEHAMLHPLMWESSSVPTLGDHPQHILNNKLIDKSDLLIAILWSKLGTPTPTADSGTVEEIREFITKKGPRRVMLYFCKRDLPYDIDPAELAKLHEFKEQMRTKGLYHEYWALEEFERDLYRHLDVKVEDFVTGQLPPPALPLDADKKHVSKDKHPDSRLHNPIDFGTTLDQIARGFAARMDEFDAIDGVHADKFYALGAHVYESVAICIDRFLTFSAAGLTEENRNVIERICSRLKRLASQLPEPKAPFPQYWADGHEISKDLSAHVALMGKWKKQ